MDEIKTKNSTIKGLFVNSHIKAVKRIKGREGLLMLENLYGKPLRFGNFENVPIAEEVRIIDCSLKIISDKPMPAKKFEYEAGRLHFKNFLTTPFARTIFNRFGDNFRMVVMIAAKIAASVFKNVELNSQEVGLHQATIIMENVGYPLQHFSGFLEAWLEQMGLIGIARGEKTPSGKYQYKITWKKTNNYR